MQSQFFVDFKTTFIKAGNGGDGKIEAYDSLLFYIFRYEFDGFLGIVSFMNTKEKAFAGPDGGDGGNGGHIIFKGSFFKFFFSFSFLILFKNI